MTYLIFFSFINAFAQETCLSGEPQNTNLIHQLSEAQAKSPITQIIDQQYNLLKKSKVEAKAECTTGVCADKNSENSQSLKQISNALNLIPEAPQLLFKPECMIRSNQFQAGAPEVSCPSGTRSKNKQLCLNQDMLAYENAVISNFLSCTQKLGFTTFTPASLFEMFSLESGFKPQFAYPGGVGIGQLTGIFIDDVHQKWRGFKFLEKIAESDLKECSAAKIIANKDIQTKPQISKSCSFIQVGEGLERNILYSLIGMANSWEKDIAPKLQPYLNKYAGNPRLEEIKNASLINVYGFGGRAAGRALISRLTALSPEKFLERIKKPVSFVNQNHKTIRLNDYSLRIAARQKEIQKELAEPLQSEFTKEGSNACINH